MAGIDHSSVKPARRPRPGLSHAREGSAAVEFAMVALPFCLMMFAILELGLVFVTDSVLENATIEQGRLIRTGQAGDAAMTPAQFKAGVCSRMSIFAADCPTRLTIDVRVIPNFGSPPDDPMKNGTFNESGLTYTNGQPGNLMVVRAWYKLPLLTTFMAQGLSRLNDGTVRMTATTAFRNEPP